MEPYDGEVLPDREVAALVGVVCGVAGAVVAFTPLALLGVVPALAGAGLGVWAAARGERAVLGSIGVFLGTSAAALAVVMTVT